MYTQSSRVDRVVMAQSSDLPLKASVIGPKSVPLRAAADKTSAKLRSLPAGEEVTILELQRTQSGTTRARTQCGWTTAQTKQGRRLLEIDGACVQSLQSRRTGSSQIAPALLRPNRSYARTDGTTLNHDCGR